MPLKRKNTDYWKLAARTAKKVKDWPEWKRGKLPENDPEDERPSRFEMLMRNAKTKEC